VQHAPRIWLGQRLLDSLSERSGLIGSGATRTTRRFVVGRQTRLSAKTLVRTADRGVENPLAG
jgi:hypothetical protein